ncbi:hypothetical protein M0802_004553 [Mischocyttarus mexicanus]|nr:hypothetical protein M0802_004553 [Mischocyttarus mexicanus]
MCVCGDVKIGQLKAEKCIEYSRDPLESLEGKEIAFDSKEPRLRTKENSYAELASLLPDIRRMPLLTALKTATLFPDKHRAHIFGKIKEDFHVTSSGKRQGNASTAPWNLPASSCISRQEGEMMASLVVAPALAVFVKKRPSIFSDIDFTATEMVLQHISIWIFADIRTLYYLEVESTVVEKCGLPMLLWSPLSPDLILCDLFSLWVHIKSTLYLTPMSQYFYDFKQRTIVAENGKGEYDSGGGGGDDETQEILNYRWQTFQSRKAAAALLGSLGSTCITGQTHHSANREVLIIPNSIDEAVSSVKLSDQVD